MKRLMILAATLAIGAAAWGIVATEGLSQSPEGQTGPNGESVDAVGYNPSAGAQLAESVRVMLGERTLKDYHKKIHQNGTNCQLCHSGEAPTSPPDDTNCIRCHGTPEQMAQVTAKLERNPHSAPHYGTNVPCTTCHKEHQPSKVLCSDCHSFTFEKFKK
ncbi:Fumarate reductase flavoprotein subunit [Pseudodesulfovibrio hydrargyri]|uniref:Fumarate reductase flavoprotein subunit n=1 Tax=Pseudodesulfovibrio hydrargyri TaxID=2125990 RepID=A0A1J5N5J3_9BACT|nr:cytochrome c3 family protein [Pseudodesulfovibrio hydrargyri]OIQ50891.1 Fumarate reductase flavoprotein subunit [Pseudodesulfovibrio hydrargyri]